MSKSSTASASAKNPSSQLPSKSAWSKGPPVSSSSPRSQSPVPTTPVSATATHSRRPSTLGQGIPIKDGVSVPRNTVSAAKTGSAVSFGSIDDAASAKMSSQPPPTTASAVQSAKSEVVKSFGTVPATVGSQINGKSAVNAKPSTSIGTSSSSAASTPSTPTTPAARAKVDIKKLFQTPSTSTPSSSTPSDPSSPSVRPSTIPPSQPPQQQPPSSQPILPSGSHSYNFVPQNGPRNQTQNGPGQPPRSPGFRSQMPNGTGPRPPNGGPPGPNQIPGSPRLPPPPHPGQPNQIPPQHMPPPPQQMAVPGWPGYYYPPMGPEGYMYPPPWGYAMPPQHAGMPPQPQMHHPPPPPGHGPPPPQPHAGMPMSPRNPPQHMQGPPGTPTPQHASAVPHTPHPPAPISHSTSNSISNITSPPATPAVSSPTVGGQRPLSSTATAFVPGARGGRVKITSPEGAEVSLDKLKHVHTPSTGSITSSPVVSLTASPSRKGIKIENPKDKEVERKKKEAEEKAKKDAEEKKKKEEEAEKKKKEEAEKAKQEEERKKKEEEDRKMKEEENRKMKEEEDRKKKEEEERKKKEEETELKKKQEEADKKKREEEQRKKKEEEEERARLEEERRKKQKEEEEAKEKERIRAEEEAKAKKEQEATAKEVKAEPEEGEVVEDESSKSETKDKEKKPLKIETGTIEPLPVRKRPGPLDLSTAKPNIPQPLPSALATARIIEDINSISYPEGIKSPKVELNVNAKNNKFRYDRDFLLQFMSICKEKPDMLPPLDAIGLEPADTSSFNLSRGGSGRHRINSGATPVRSASGFGPGSSFGKSGPGSSFGGMGNFATPNSAKLTSEERFQLANRSASVGGPAGMQFPRPGGMQRTASQGGPGGMDSRRTRSKRGDKRPDANKAPNHGGSAFGSGYGANAAPLEPVAPLQVTENRWDRKGRNIDEDSPAAVDRKVKGLLNKITMEKFDSISDQIISWANKSEKEKDGRTLIQVIRLVFEKATDEATFSEMYARLCRKMMEQISPAVQDDGIKNAEGKPIAGGQLFRKYLLNRCQEDFERGWVAKEATAAAAAAKSIEDKAVKDKEKKEDGEDGEVALYSDEYYAAQKAKRQGLGLIRFIGELFKLQMLTERIMHECVKKLLGNVENPEEEEIESLCKLLTTIGQSLDTPKARAHMDVYFSRMKELTKSGNVNSRMQFMLQDVIELRERKWLARTAIQAPSTIKQVHDQAAKADQAYSRNLSMSRTNSRRGNERQDSTAPDGWAVAGGSVRAPPKAGDLSQFGKISNKGAPITFGPSSVFNKKDAKRESLSRTNSSANMFQMLQNDAVAEPSTSKSSRPPSRKASIDLGHGGMATSDQPPQRKKLVLQPRSKPVEGASRAGSENNSDEEEEETEEPEAEMSEADAKKKIDEDSKEFFAVRNLDEAEVYFEKLSSQFHTKLADKLVSFALESKEADAQLVSDLLQRASSKSLASSAALEEAFTSLAEFLDDIVYDAPKAPNLFALMMRGAGFNEEQRTRITSKSAENGQKVLELSS